MLVGWNKIKVYLFSSLSLFNKFPFLLYVFSKIPTPPPYSLIATIRVARPDVVNDSVTLLMGEGQPISKEMPPHYFDKHIAHIEGIGEPTTATFFTRSNIDPTKWFVILLFFLSFSYSNPSPSYQVDVGEI